MREYCAVFQEKFSFMYVTDDKTLSEACVRGDKDAAAELYRRFSPRLLSLCLRYCPDRSSAEDTMHDSFVKILESIRKYSYQGEGTLYSWMARLTVNLCFDSARKRRKALEGIVQDFDMGNIPQEDLSENFALIPSEVLHSMVQELPPGYGTVFKLYVIDGLSHAEIGRMLGIKEKSSASSLVRARAILTKKIRDYCNEH